MTRIFQVLHRVTTLIKTRALISNTSFSEASIITELS